MITPSSRRRVAMNSNPANTDARVGGSRAAAGPLATMKLTKVMEVQKNSTQSAATATGLAA